MVSINHLKQLREETGISLIECKKALQEAQGDVEKAKEILKEKGKEMIKDRKIKKGAGIIESYIHGEGKIGVLLELDCETDFVARSPEFKRLAHEICLQIAALNPLFISPQKIPEEFIIKEKKIYQKQCVSLNKPKEIIEKIIQGKLEKYKKEISLLTQFWIKDETKTIEKLIDEYAAKVGEKIIIKRFTRYEI